jgi:hypothetical protein
MPENENNQKEASLIGDAADVHFELVFLTTNKWKLSVSDIAIDLPSYDPDNASVEIEVTSLQAAAVVSLFLEVGEVPNGNIAFVKKLYDIAEPVFALLPKTLRFIP